MALVEIPDDLLIRLYTQKTTDQENAVQDRIDALEERMSELSGAVGAQTQAIQDLATRISQLDAGALQARVAELTQALADADAARVALADAEAAEDVIQQAEIDRLTQEANDASGRVNDLLAQVQSASDDIASGVQGIQANTATLNTLAQTDGPQG